MARVNRRITHDSMVISAKFQSGASFKWSIGRGGERYDFRFSSNESELRRQYTIFKAWNDRPCESNLERFDRLEAICKKHESGAAVISAMEQENR